MATQAPAAPTAEHVITFTDEAWRDMEVWAARRGQRIDQLITDALGLLAWYEDALKDGGKIIVKRANGNDTIVRAKK